MRSPRRHRRLWGLLGISLLLHLAAIGLWQAHDTPLSLQFSPQTASLAVSLTAIEIAATPGPTPARGEQAVTTGRPEPRARPDRHLPRRERATDSVPTTTAAVKPAATQPAAGPSRPPALNRARIIARLREDLAQHFYYPPLARRRNLQGTVLLAFDVTNEGRIERIGIRKSSGYAILDLAAREAMQRLARLDWLAGKLDRGRMNIELPVIYKLTES
jgi:protein TonB